MQLFTCVGACRSYPFRWSWSCRKSNPEPLAYHASGLPLSFGTVAEHWYIKPRPWVHLPASLSFIPPVSQFSKGLWTIMTKDIVFYLTMDHSPSCAVPLESWDDWLKFSTKDWPYYWLTNVSSPTPWQWMPSQLGGFDAVCHFLFYAHWSSTLMA